MSVDRLPALTPQPPQTAQPTRDIHAAQRAFFQAAASEPVAAAPTAPVRTSAPATPVDPQRPLRPGSLLDIRV